MPKRLPLSKKLVALLLFSLFALVATCIPSIQSEPLSYAIQIVATSTALVACCRRAMVSTRPWRMPWILVASGIALSTCGVVLAVWEELVVHKPFAVASLSDFAFFFYGVPILLVISTPAQGQRSPIFTYLNWVEAGFAAVLVYIAIFPEFPVQTNGTRPVSLALLLRTYDIENLALSLCCLVRVLAAPRGSIERLFYRTLLTFLVTFGLGLALYERLAVSSAAAQDFSFLVDVPYLLFALLVHRLPQNADERTVVPSPFVALVVDNASPIFFTLALLGLVLEVLPQHMHLGMAAIGVALGAYAIRTTLLQIKFMVSQRRLMQAHDRLEQMTLQDSLTGIANRRSFDQTYELEWYRMMRSEEPLSLMIIDLDFFKQLNDAQGHPSGDRCLIKVAEALHSTMTRSGDLVARHGGEEFAVILPRTEREAALGLALQFQNKLSKLAITNETPLGPTLTASIGIATHDFLRNITPNMLVEAADAALYVAKRKGRNRIEAVLIEEALSRSEDESIKSSQGQLRFEEQAEL